MFRNLNFDLTVEYFGFTHYDQFRRICAVNCIRKIIIIFYTSYDYKYSYTNCDRVYENGVVIKFQRSKYAASTGSLRLQVE